MCEIIGSVAPLQYHNSSFFVVEAVGVWKRTKFIIPTIFHKMYL